MQLTALTALVTALVLGLALLDRWVRRADLLMRVEDAREVAVPTVVWSLPVVSVFDAGLDPWNIGWLVFIVLSAIALALITAGTARAALAGHGAR
ncbi:hypothetical protein [Actinoplanes couchii]|uniref:Uncharacterized protein n=1 Tax=Actinoplanes couchii TaxID=403638 RepID=A0ABQ3XEH6_9ACTN|nr:hypothetical protein [Actinoplanes couchii]MDR6317327.1 hypothetical protein [Actinoplanes couchii]GID56820.1 hypothetical protein Aco03nite_052240 [Actinoplanes couchii]